LNVASSSTGPALKIFLSLDTPSATPLNSRGSYVRGWFAFADAGFLFRFDRRKLLAPVKLIAEGGGGATTRASSRFLLARHH
jgi:hypothetical protein